MIHKTLAIIALLNLPRIGRKSVLKMYNDIDSLSSNNDDLILELYETLKIYKFNFSKDDVKTSFDYAENIIIKSKSFNVYAMSIFDNKFPKSLRQIPDCPVIIYFKGDVINSANNDAIAVIGTRSPTTWGRKAANRIGSRLAENDFTVVSGLANGCDEESHWGCVNKKGLGIAILAHGLDNIYPKKNKKLSEKILENQGCIISEYPIYYKPRRNTFIERDRLQSAMSSGVLVIETGIKGGSMHTVGYAEKQNKKIACLYQDDESWLKEECTKGNQNLIKNKNAYAINDYDDFHEFIKSCKVNIEDRKLKQFSFDFKNL